MLCTRARVRRSTIIDDDGPALNRSLVYRRVRSHRMAGLVDLTTFQITTQHNAA